MSEIDPTASIDVYGAREHNLKDVHLSIPRNKLVVFTGLSGSGKSSLAFDTIFAEGQRRYIETFSSYARQFLGGMERPDVEKIDGLSPVISIEQKTVSRSPRSTVGTITEIYDFLRLLYARIGTAYSYVTDEPMVKYSDDQITDLILEQFNDQKIVILAPKIKGRKGHYRELFEQIAKMGYTRVRVDGEIQEIERGMRLDRYKIHDIEIVIDRLHIQSTDRKRLYDSIVTAMKHGNKSMMVGHYDTGGVRHFSRLLMCPTSGVSYPEPEPSLFSFNSPYGACPTCSGLGEISEIDQEKVIPDPKLSIKKGGLAPIGEYKKNWFFEKLDNFLQQEGFSLNTPIQDISPDLIHIILNGNEGLEQGVKDTSVRFEGLANFMARHAEESTAGIQRWAQSFMNRIPCPECHGARLKKEALHFRIAEKTLGQVASMDLQEVATWLETIDDHLTNDQRLIGTEILKEISARVRFILEVGLDYLTLHRSAKSLSGGEAQRIRLATQIGSELMNVLYILDEPSIGLHQRDNTRLINSLKRLRDAGNSVIVVEHDREMMEAADFVVDIGPGAGVHGGQIVNAAPFAELTSVDSMTTKYLLGELEISLPKTRRKGNGKQLKLKGATGNNLKNVDLTIPLGTLTCVTGVSGSGKSTLINHTLYPILNAHIFNGVKKPMPYKTIDGLDHLDKVIEIDQSPIGRTPRSNPATYTNVFTEIRSLFASLPEAQIRGYKAGRFSFNVAGGRCETCGGGGLKVIEMNFLPDVYVECETCNGKRYNRETLEVRFKGKSINDVLEMTIEDSAVFFESIPKISRVLVTLNSVGLGYVKLGQPSTTLSGGEAQRIKLASELSKRGTGNTIYILDEPSTGLHFEDIRMLTDVLQRLVNDGNTVLVIEHNMDIIKVADHIIDVGPEGGRDGGYIVCTGTPEELIKKHTEKSYTAKYLKMEVEHMDKIRKN
ncbi:MAG: excinuclease ABC subunit A [Candidatus Fluviicola riflensis]|nr:MAG: excinuclease ABC subunit A [Candidatus Fluviicola riflensis]OGS76586.1 MAG: excinuclease ABC subunit A [Candidatus Fluviicola riflensis]OGS83059.1 MAG: excinuclease ABC subunit A [Fluviicola sp. RIFCSPHIGHO2_01_FULL_43_53]OGS88317.1 MAG: excinuclease ABC subunit A [Fluviicola sp. RIFCSPHIGHO2_12_FULL_43_24]